jgi:hypothetical protein
MGTKKFAKGNGEEKIIFLSPLSPWGVSQCVQKRPQAISLGLNKQSRHTQARGF